MTRITIDKDLLSVSARGHAGFDRTGRDIVCAAASMLMFALCAFAEDNGGAGFTEGDLFRVEFPAEENDYLFGGFDAICEGLRLLADRYPDHVSVEG